MGNEASEHVWKANKLVSRLVLLILVGIVLHNVRFWVEQPGSSILEKHTRWVELSQTLGGMLRTVHVWMGRYGGDTPKPTLLYTNSLEDLPEPPKSVRSSAPSVDGPSTYMNFVDASGRSCVNGLRAGLKSSQTYPPGFGIAVASAHLRRDLLGPGVALPALDSFMLSDDPWSDADLAVVLEDLQRM